jgi:uncharacterized surface protein with fasciclin (FAS1) repeats
MKQIIILVLVLLGVLALVAYFINRNRNPVNNILQTPTVTPSPIASPTPTPLYSPTSSLSISQKITPKPSNEPNSGKNLYETIKNESTISSFARALDQTKLNEVLTGVDNYTVFALTNDAMQKINDNNYSTDQLNQFLKSHISYGNIDINKSKDMLTLNGDTVRINNPKPIKSIKANNGTIYIIDHTLTQ